MTADLFIPHRCDFCRYGIVWPARAENDWIHVRDGLVLLEGFIIGKCNRCGHRHFPAQVVKRAEQVAQHPELATRFAQLPVVIA